MKRFALLQHAISLNELYKFITGEAPYFMDVLTDTEEPQIVSAAFETRIYPYWIMTADLDFPAQFAQALVDAIHFTNDRNKAIYVVLDWLWFYYDSLAKCQAGRGYPGLFTLDTQALAPLLAAELQAHKAALMRDVRWAGASWNSSEGLWQPVCRLCFEIKALNGPDLLPR